MQTELFHPAAEPLISAVIVSFNTRAMTLDCLQTLIKALAGLSAEIVVVDNASHDGSADAITASFPGVHLLRNERNAGFGAANNLGMQAARGEFFLLLNSDAFPEPDAIRALVDFLHAHPRAGVAGPRTLNGDGSLQISCYKLPSPAHAWLENLWLSSGYSRWAHDRQRAVEFVIGACMLVRRAVVDEVGGFDEQFFMYSEEADWQRRMHDRGWGVFFVPEARVVHLGGASGANDRARINRYFFESLDRYVKKHHGFVGLLALRSAMTIGCLVRAALWTAKALQPSQRERALAKVRLHIWLVVRQLTHWEFRN